MKLTGVLTEFLVILTQLLAIVGNFASPTYLAVSLQLLVIVMDFCTALPHLLSVLAEFPPFMMSETSILGKALHRSEEDKGTRSTGHDRDELCRGVHRFFLFLFVTRRSLPIQSGIF